MLRQVKSYIDNDLNPAKVNVIDTTNVIFSANQFQKNSR